MNLFNVTKCSFFPEVTAWELSEDGPVLSAAKDSPGLQTLAMNC